MGVPIPPLKRSTKAMRTHQRPKALQRSSPVVGHGSGKLATVAGIIFCLLLLLAPLVWWPTAYNYEPFKRAFIHVMAVGCLILWTVRRAQSRSDLSLGFSTFDLLVLLYLSLAAVSILWAHNRFLSLMTLSHWGVCVLCYFAVSRHSAGETWQRRFLFMMALSVGVFSLIGWGQHLFGLDWFSQAWQPAATFINRDSAVQVVVLILPVMLVLFFQPSSFAERAVLFACTVVAIVYLLYSMVRSGWAALLVSAVFILFLSLKESRFPDSLVRVNRSALKWAALAVLIILVAGNLNPSTHASGLAEFASRAATLADIIDDPSKASTGRIPVWRNILAMIQDRPVLGVGLGNFEVFYPLYNRSVVKAGYTKEWQLTLAHNDLLQAAAEIGIPAALLLSAIFGFSIILSCRLVRISVSPQDRLLAIGIGGAIIGIAVDSMFTFPLQLTIPPLFLAVLLGILSSLASRNDLLPFRFKLTLSRKTIWALLIILLLAEVQLISAHYRFLKSDIESHYAEAAVMRKEYSKAKLHSERALVSNPNNKDALYTAGHANLHSGAPALSIPLYMKILEDYPHDPMTLYNLGLTYFHQNQFERAIHFFSLFCGIIPDDSAVLLKLAISYFNLGNLQESISRLEHALSLFPNNALFHYNLGVAYEANGENTKADEHFRTAEQLKKKKPSRLE